MLIKRMRYIQRRDPDIREMENSSEIEGMRIEILPIRKITTRNMQKYRKTRNIRI